MVWSGDQDHGCEAVAADSLRIQTEADRMEGLIQQDAEVHSSQSAFTPHLHLLERLV
jgi:hypothetical protein